MEFIQCKIRYLSNQNNWLSLQCKNLDQINILFKKVLNKTQKNQNKHLQNAKVKIQSQYTNNSTTNNNNLSQTKSSYKHNKQITISLYQEQIEKNSIKNQNDDNSISLNDQIEEISESISLSLQGQSLIDQIELQQLSDIQYALKQRIKYHQNHLKILKNIDQTQIQQFEDKIYFYYETLQAYDKKLLQKNSQLFQHQMRFQKIQNNKQQRKRIQIQEKIKDFQINSVIEYYEAFPRLHQHFNKKKDQLLQRLSLCKKIPSKLNKNLKNIKSSSKKNLNQNDNYLNKPWKTAREVNSYNTTIFQSTLLCLKKKNYQNKHLKKVIQQLRKKKDQIQKASFLIQNSLQKKENKQKPQKIAQKDSIKKIQQHQFSISMSKIKGKTILNSNKYYEDFNKQIDQNNCILDNLGGMGYNVKGFSAQIWEDIPSLLVD